MLEKLSHPSVKAAIAAWQDKNAKAWFALFTDNPKLFDDAQPRDFKSFSAEMGKEHFTSIDKVDNGGLDVYGHFHSDTWGDFRTYFKFHVGADGKFDRLDIGQA